MNKTYKDTDLREALRRKYADTPQLPVDFLEGLTKRAAQQSKARRTVRLWRTSLAAIAVAASIVAIVLLVKPQQAESDNVLVAATPTEQIIPLSRIDTVAQPIPVSSAKVVQPVERRRKKTVEQSSDDNPLTTPITQSDPNLHYVAQTTADTDRRAPALVDDFIEKFADFYGVKGKALYCADRSDTTVVSMAYVFPDKKEVDVFRRLLMIAVTYDDLSPGYLLNYSHRQVFFQPKDLHLGQKYLWIAERVGGRILLYATHSPIEAEVSSDCFREYRDKLTNTNIHQTSKAI